MARIALFAYGSLVAPESAARTLGRSPDPLPASLRRWRRRWSQARDNLAVEKTFALAGGELPRWILGLNLEPDGDPGAPPNGALIEVSERELERLDGRELRYDRVDVRDDVEGEHDFDRVVAYRAKPIHFAPVPPSGGVILASYLGAVELAFERLGEGQLELFRRTTGPPPVEVVEATLVRDRIPDGNPRAW
jgi:hypothetical protein